MGWMNLYQQRERLREARGKFPRKVRKTYLPLQELVKLGIEESPPDPPSPRSTLFDVPAEPKKEPKKKRGRKKKEDFSHGFDGSAYAEDSPCVWGPLTSKK